MSANRYDALVLGGGTNGLVAAARLGRAGLRVLVLEREKWAGGRRRPVEFARGFRASPFASDAGWVPRSVARGLGLALEPESEAWDTPLSVAAGPGSFLTLSRDPARAADSIRAHSARDAAKWPAFTTRLAKLAGFLEALYAIEAPDVAMSHPREWGPMLGLAARFRPLGREDGIELLRTLPLSVWEMLDDWFECAPLKAGIAAGGVQDHRQGPRSGGTGFVLLHHLVGAPVGTVRGRPFARGGTDAFPRAVEEVARRAGVSVRAGAAVTRIQIRDDAVSGVILESGEEIAAERVLSTADPSRTLLDWVDPVWLDPEFLHAVANIRYRGCAVFVLYALETLPEIPGLEPQEALAGIVSLTPTLTALEKAADAAKYGRISEQPHVEMTVPSLRWPELAPEGRHVLVARAQYAPYRLRDGSAWTDAAREDLADRVTAAIESFAPCFRSRVRHRVAWSPRDIEERYGWREGAPTEGELALDQVLFMRPVAGWGRHATPIGGLYLGGAGTHPGPGVLGGPGWLAAGRLLADRRRRRSPP